MKKLNLFRRLRPLAPFVAVGLLVILSVPPLLAQQFTHNTTTLAAAQAATDTTINLTSASAATGSSFGAVQAGQLVWVDQELETLVSVTSTSTIWNVQRRGRLTSHAIAAPVYIGAPGSFQAADPPAGTCVVANQPKFWINTITAGAGATGTGGIFTCATNGIWTKGSAPYFGGLNSGNGATVTLTAADSGKTFLFDRAAGIIYTLPAPYPGMTFDFVYTVTITSNAAVVITNSASVFVAGITHVAVSGGITGLDFACNGTTHVKITSNGTTSGGILGGHVRFVAASSTVWVVDGLLVGSGSTVTPCST